MDRIQHGGEDMAHQRRKLKKIAEKKSGQERRRKGGNELEEKGTEGKGGEGKGRERKRSCSFSRSILRSFNDVKSFKQFSSSSLYYNYFLFFIF